MKKTLCQTIQLESELLDGRERGFYLDYYLTEHECSASGTIAALCYGVQIEKRYFGENVCAESAASGGMFLSECEGIKWISFLSAHTVTPISLPEVLEDLLCCEPSMPVSA